MKAFKILNIKQFMTTLLSTEVFDLFYLEEAVITTYNTFTIDGHINFEFYPSEILNQMDSISNFSSYKSIKPILFSLIKGKYTPISFRISLLIPKEKKGRFEEQINKLQDDNGISNFTLNIKYDGTSIILITSTALETFQLNHDSSKQWDENMSYWLFSNQIEWEDI